MDFEFYNEIGSRSPARVVLVPARRAARRLMRPVLYRLRDLLRGLYAAQQDAARHRVALQAELVAVRAEAESLRAELAAQRAELAALRAESDTLRAGAASGRDEATAWRADAARHTLSLRADHATLAGRMTTVEDLLLRTLSVRQAA